MPLTPKIRVNFKSDAGFLLRLSRAIEADEERPLEFRQKAVGLLNELSVLLLQADTFVKVDAPKKKGKK